MSPESCAEAADQRPGDGHVGNEGVAFDDSGIGAGPAENVVADGNWTDFAGGDDGPGGSSGPADERAADGNGGNSAFGGAGDGDLRLIDVGFDSYVAEATGDGGLQIAARSLRVGAQAAHGANR